MIAPGGGSYLLLLWLQVVAPAGVVISCCYGYRLLLQAGVVIFCCYGYRLLLQAGVDINLQTAQGTCLHEAALCGKLDVVRLLLDVRYCTLMDNLSLTI